jgi:hypothetical protein
MGPPAIRVEASEVVSFFIGRIVLREGNRRDVTRLLKRYAAGVNCLDVGGCENFHENFLWVGRKVTLASSF